MGKCSCHMQIWKCFRCVPRFLKTRRCMTTFTKVTITVERIWTVIGLRFSFIRNWLFALIEIILKDNFKHVVKKMVFFLRFCYRGSRLEIRALVYFVWFGILNFSLMKLDNRLFPRNHLLFRFKVPKFKIGDLGIAWYEVYCKTWLKFHQFSFKKSLFFLQKFQ